jgi:hypothetical protein
MDLDKINPYLVVASLLVLVTLWLVWASMTTFSPAFATPRTDVTLALDSSYRQAVPADQVLQPYVEGRDKRPRNIFEPEEVTRETLHGLDTPVAPPPPPPITLPEPPVMLGFGAVEVQ